MGRIAIRLLLGLTCLASAGCYHLNKRPTVTALPASPQNQGEPPGIPFYLPKPLLVISKNFYHIEDPKVGLTHSAPVPGYFDNQSSYGDLNLRSTFSRSSEPPSGTIGGDTTSNTFQQEIPVAGPGPVLHSSNGIPFAPDAQKIPSDGLAPHMFFTYEIVFVPDLTQKYALQIEGGAGEIRAAMNLVNGWQFTGLGPYYMKDSSTAQNVLARGVALNLGLGGAADVVNSVANLRSLAEGNENQVPLGAMAALAQAMQKAAAQTESDLPFLDPSTWRHEVLLDPAGNPLLDRNGQPITRAVPPRIERYAEIHVFEPHLVDGCMAWRPAIAGPIAFDREYLGSTHLQKNPQAVDAIQRAMERAATPPEELPAPAAAPQAAGPLGVPAGSSLVTDVVKQTLQPRLPEKKRGWFDWLHGKRGSVTNQTVVGTVDTPIPQP